MLTGFLLCQSLLLVCSGALCTTAAILGQEGRPSLWSQIGHPHGNWRGEDEDGTKEAPSWLPMR